MAKKKRAGRWRIDFKDGTVLEYKDSILLEANENVIILALPIRKIRGCRWVRND